MLEALAEWMGFPMYYAVYGGTPPPRTGASHAAIAPYGPFSCQDGKLVFIGIQNQREWAVFCAAVLGKPDLAEDPRFSSNSRRVSHRTDLTEEISSIFHTLASEEVVSRLDAANIANARLRDMSELAEHPQLEARQRWAEVDSPVGSLRTLVPPATLDGDEPVMGRIPEPGEHTAAVLAELGIPDEAGR
jgi:crotonobetainyl-CoA:carnitine CoA-transferase CaiB-like acyl-CoA transferase